MRLKALVVLGIVALAAGYATQREQFGKRIADLAPGGGYVLGAVHNIQAEVPVENVLAMLDAAREFGRY